jgi:hypothetical protein
MRMQLLFHSHKLHWLLSRVFMHGLIRRRPVVCKLRSDYLSTGSTPSVCPVVYRPRLPQVASHTRLNFPIVSQAASIL